MRRGSWARQDAVFSIVQHRTRKLDTGLAALAMLGREGFSIFLSLFPLYPEIWCEAEDHSEEAMNSCCIGEGEKLESFRDPDKVWTRETER